MENNSMWIKNIRTNNLKGIDIEIKKKALNCIIGPSGSGKSTLAFNTIYSICEHEYKVMIGDDDIYEYDVEDYGNILVSISLRQSNFNINKRSTIATYYGLDKLVKFIYASEFNMPSDVFSFNKNVSACKVCNGLGYIEVPDMSALVDYDLTLRENPFFPWQNSSSRNLFKQSLENVANEMDIPLNVPFRNLTNAQKDFLLNGRSHNKYKITYTQNGRKRIKTDYFTGICVYIQNIAGEKQNVTQYTKEIVCQECAGTRFNKKINKFKIFNKSIGELYMMEFSELLIWINKFNGNFYSIISINALANFASKCIEMNLGYMSLNRSIPSLSGGEFQRLRLSQLLNSKFENLLFVIDEPLASLHISEKDGIIDQFVNMKNKNTLLLVEHDTGIVPICDNIIALGPSGGNLGGELVDPQTYIMGENIQHKIDFFESQNEIMIESTSNVNNVKPFKIKLPCNTCIGVSGVSGSGKTTFIKEILPKLVSNYKYISQKPIKGNSYSHIASYLNISDKIRDLFAEVNKMNSAYFSSYANANGACKTCHGTGKIIVEEYNKNYSYICPSCTGTKYNDEISKYKYFSHSIIEIMNMEINDALAFFKDKSEPISAKLFFASSIGLGYLKLNQEIPSLSGGESQRMKLIRNIDIRKTNNIFALDEPFQGLNNTGTLKVMTVLYNIISKGNTIIIVEHSLFALKMCAYIIEFGVGSGKYGGDILFLGKTQNIDKSEKSLLKKYM